MPVKRVFLIGLRLCAVTLLPFSSRAGKAEDQRVSDSDEIGFHERIEYVGVAARDPEKNIWGCSPVVGDECRVN
jgi:hypothetical protein